MEYGLYSKGGMPNSGLPIMSKDEWVKANIFQAGGRYRYNAFYSYEAGLDKLV